MSRRHHHHILEVDMVYKMLCARFIINRNRDEIIERLHHCCSEWLQNGVFENIYFLKQRLVTEFSHDVDCKYAYLTLTPNDYGCDLREMLFKKDFTLRQGSDALLRLFFRATAAGTGTRWHILTDIDDTLYATGHGFMAGSDVSWHQGVPYPGIFSFYASFYDAAGTTNYSTVLSASPGIVKSRRMNDPQLKSILGSKFGFLQGFDEKRELFWALLAATHPRHVSYANKKFERFLEYSRIFPEHKHVFIGDSGKGDVITGLRMLAASSTCIVCIHRVCKDGRTHPPLFPLPAIAGLAVTAYMTARLFAFKNYAELARVFNVLKIFKKNDVVRVASEMRAELLRPENFMFAHLYQPRALQILPGSFASVGPNVLMRARETGRQFYSSGN